MPSSPRSPARATPGPTVSQRPAPQRASADVERQEREGPAEIAYQKGVSALRALNTGDALAHFEQAMGLLEQQTGNKPAFAVRTPTPQMFALEWADSGRRLAAVDQFGVSVYTRKGRELFRLDFDGTFAKVALSPAGETIAVTGRDGTGGVELHAVDSGRMLGRFSAGRVTALALAPKADKLILCPGGSGCDCAVFDVRSKKQISSVDCDVGDRDTWIEEARFSPDGAWLAFARGKGVEVRSTKTLAPGLQRSKGKQIGFADAKTLSIESEDGVRELYDVASQQRVRKVTAPSSVTPAGARVREGRMLSATDVAVGGKLGVTLSGEQLQIWLASGKLVRSWPAEKVRDFYLAPDGRTLATVHDSRSGGPKLAFVDLETGESRTLAVPVPIEALALDPPALAFHSGERTHVMREQDLVVLDAGPAPERLFLTGRGDRLAESSTHVRTWKRGESGYTEGPLGTLASADSYTEFDDRSGELVLTKISTNQSATFAPAGAVRAVALSADGRLLAVGTSKCEVEVFDASGKLLTRLPGGPPGDPNDGGHAAAGFVCVASELGFSPNGKRVLSVEGGGRTFLYDVGAKRIAWRSLAPQRLGVATDWGAVVTDHGSVTTLWRPGQSEPDWTSVPVFAVRSLAAAQSWIAIAADDGLDVLRFGANKRDTQRIAKLYALNDLDAAVVTTADAVEIIGADAEKARALLTCRFGSVSYPFELCASRFVRKQLWASLFSAGTR